MVLGRIVVIKTEMSQAKIPSSENLAKAILAKAFRGELPTPEAELARSEGRSYELASVLLARIKAESRFRKPQGMHEKSKRERN